MQRGIFWVRLLRGMGGICSCRDLSGWFTGYTTWYNGLVEFALLMRLGLVDRLRYGRY